MSLPPRYLATKLSEPLPTTDGGTLHTIGDATRYMTKLPKHREEKNAWQYAAKLILNRAPVDAVTRQLSLALFMDAKLDLRAQPRSTRLSSDGCALPGDDGANLIGDLGYIGAFAAHHPILLRKTVSPETRGFIGEQCPRVGFLAGTMV
jgi:hypothetical protein